MAVRIISQVQGVSSDNSIAPLTRITLQPNTPGNPNAHAVATGSSAVVAALQALLGQNVSIYIAVSPAEIAAIEAAVPINPIDVGD